ncbi:Protein HEADING DATE 3A [Morella rubra]|uniref:Protein HEADING DATE 3A n=1 Tax=Morella rubra TaxID=262757 RepID=A0A6A1URV1_9ROSI|nr:Protein HEADING DATE 3A [Morella rubra]
MYGLIQCVWEEVVFYESPRSTMGIHRFIFVLFRQMRRQTIIYSTVWRQNFNARGFVEIYDLGLPVAAFYFNCRRERDSDGRRRYD